MSFRTALTGLNAASTDLSVISNNIANNNTTGFKESRAEFSDIFSKSAFGTATRRAIGGGVQLAAVTQQFKQGNLNATGNPLDIAIDGEGFFRLNDNGSIVYTRAGTFGVDREGFVVDSIGRRLTGFQANQNGELTRTTSDIRLTTTDIQPQSTSGAQFGVNLDAGSAPPANIFDINDPDSYNHTTSMTVFDSLGNGHTLSIYFVKNAASNAWTYHLSVDGTDPAHVTIEAPAPGNPPGAPAANNTLAFQSNGLLDTAGTGLENPDGTINKFIATIDLDAVATELNNGNPVTVGAETPLVIDIDLSEATQFGGPSSTNALVQDGFTSGRLVGVNVDDDGVMFGRFSNGQSKVLGQVALVNFRNVQGLQPIGDTSWAESFASGVPVVGPPGTASLGLVRSGALEGSNVELSEQLVNMINAQRNFQANAQVISTADTLTQALLNLR